MDSVREGAAARAVAWPDGSVDLSATARPLLESPPSRRPPSTVGAQDEA